VDLERHIDIFITRRLKNVKAFNITDVMEIGKIGVDSFFYLIKIAITSQPVTSVKAIAGLEDVRTGVFLNETSLAS
jgi:hypothetical protein